MVDGPNVRVLAHRGASARAPENTIAAFALARELGADGVELDVRLLVDGALAVHHDAVLPDGRVIADLGRADLPPHVPVLSEVLTVCGAHRLPLEVNVEIKNSPGEPGHDSDAKVAAVVGNELERLAYPGRLSVSSFNVATLAAFRSAAPHVPTGWLTSDRVAWPAALDRLVAEGHDAVHPHHRLVTAELVGAARARSLGVVVWTVDDPARMAELVALGVDAIITNVPDVARSMLDAGAFRRRP